MPRTEGKRGGKGSKGGGGGGESGWASVHFARQRGRVTPA